ncbi:MAG: FHA domain-containing protein [Myxococcaceae bacterium]|nr:FHA domain-containing protein [Myxococcaceae bacterium]
MLKLIIEDDEGRKTVVPFVREEITIGRQEGNTIRLTERNVSRRHARLLRQNGHVVVEDLGSSNGTRINGERISGQSAVKDGDLIQIGDYDLALQSDAAAATARMRPAPAAQEASDSEASASEPETETETPVQEDEAGANGAANGEQRRHSTAIIRMEHVEGTRSRKVEELEAEEAPRLVVVSSEFKGQEYACIRTEMRIGRTEDNDIVIDHRSLSRTHAKIVREDNGEWRIIDMQSANGMTVNGESYAQASLNHGDMVELGHVKLRFIGAGEAVGALARGDRSKLPLVLAIGVVVLGGAGAAFFFLKQGAPPPPPEVTQNDPSTPPQPTEPEPQEVQPPEQQTPPEEPNPAAAAEKARKELEERLHSVQQSLEDGELDKAENDLGPARKPDGTWPPEAKPLADRIAAERKARQALDDARAALTAQKYDDALKQLALADGSKIFAAEREALRAEIEEARKTRPETARPQTPPTKPPPLAANMEQEASSAYEAAATLLRQKQYNQALTMGLKCEEYAPNKAECHMVLGAAFAGMAKWDEAAKHYRKFLDLAPDHKMAHRVRQTLENYESSK